MTSEHGIPPHTAAFIDFGTNSLRLLVVRFEPNQAYTTLHQLKETVRLGEGGFDDQRLQPDAMVRALAGARRFVEVAIAAGATEFVAVGTAAIREAENGREFIRHLYEQTGVQLHAVSGREEARLIYLGVSSGIDLSRQDALFIDIGGGSTETSIGNGGEPAYLNSLKLGAIRLSNQFLAHAEGPVDLETYREIKSYLLNEASRSIAEMRKFGVEMAVGTSGTIENLADVAVRASRNRARQPQDVVTLGELSAAIRMLCDLPLAERGKVPGINPARADIIIGGAAIIEGLMQALAIDELQISDRGLRDGLLLDYLARHGHRDVTMEVPLRLRTVLQLGRNCRFNEAHALHTATLAGRLFDTARDAGLHAMGEESRELLQHAAHLHHIGSFLTFSGYQKHSHYLVRNADLIGFDEYEKMLISLIVLNHRGSLTRDKDPELANLNREQERDVIILATLLRLAENLDRGQAGVITDACISVEGKNGLVLEGRAARDPEVEVSGIESQRDVVKQVFGRDLVRHVYLDESAPPSAAARNSEERSVSL